MKLLVSFLLAIGCLSVYAKDIKEYVVTTTPPMSCQNCENRIKGNLRFEKGVKKIETDLEHQRVTVTYDADKTTEAKIEEAFGKLNYQVTKIEEGDKKSCKNANNPCNGKTECCKDKDKDKDKREKTECCKNKK